MKSHLKFYIDGEWVAPNVPTTFDVIGPSTEELSGRLAMGGQADVDAAVAAARKAFESFSRSSVEQRIELLRKIESGLKARQQDMIEAITAELSAPLKKRGTISTSNHARTDGRESP